MQLHEVRRATKRKKKKIIGRGGKRGAYSGRGIKGQRARAGRRIRPALRDVLKRIPKRRGESGGKQRTRRRTAYVVNVDQLQKYFQTGETVSPQALAERGLIHIPHSKRVSALIKILGRGTLEKALTVKGCAVSASAAEKITKAGGSVHTA